MWFLKYFTKSKKTEESPLHEKEQTSNKTKSTKRHKIRSHRRGLRSKDRSVIRQVAKRLRCIGDDIERRGVQATGAQLAGEGGGLPCPKFCKKQLYPHKHGYIYGTKYFKLVCVVNLSPLINSRTIT